jgi:hypothetical protein
LYGPIWTLEINSSLALIFFRFAHMYIMSSGTISLLRVWTNSTPINSEKYMTKLNDPHYTELGRLRI